MPGDMWQKFANLKTLYAYMYAQPGKKLLFMGSEFGQWKEWNVDTSLDWHLTDHEPHRKLMDFVRDLNNIYKTERAFYEVDFDHQGFEWIDFGDYANSIVSFIRKAKDPDDFIVCVFNFTPVSRTNYRVGVPKGGFYKELLNSDSERFWGSNVGNWGGFNADDVWWQGKPFSLNLNIPPLGAVFMKPYREEVVTITEADIKEQQAKELQAAKEAKELQAAKEARELQAAKEAKELQAAKEAKELQAAKEAKELATENTANLKTAPAEKTVTSQIKPTEKK
ncbi:1,4-alpha-glucan branching enzyme [Candidatus Magnetobacterium bavaricum]|uniref:1,4-alpha-glucan branching enzyme n=1 Tax=Candidatus Magnetobacterium bavaricum TaxID=29290 RepID=A0A0F3GJ64_9BACT|nr:1,4-alpha-glucan branching enzyme [Candidatus Magnetobacterium bavaricum]